MKYKIIEKILSKRMQDDRRYAWKLISRGDISIVFEAESTLSFMYYATYFPDFVVNDSGWKNKTKTIKKENYLILSWPVLDAIKDKRFKFLIPKRLIEEALIVEKLL